MVSLNISLKRKMHVGCHVRVFKKEYHHSPWFPIKQYEDMGFHFYPEILKIINEVLAEQQFQNCVFFKEAPDSDFMAQELTGSFTIRDTWGCLNAAESSCEPVSQEEPTFSLAACPFPSSDSVEVGLGVICGASRGKGGYTQL